MTETIVHIPRLDTDRLILRPPAAQDTGPILAFLGTPRAEFYGGPMNANDAWKKLAIYAGQWLLRGYGMFTLTRRDTGETIGMAGPYHPQDFPEPELSWLLTDPAQEGHGYASEACAAILTHLFTDLGWAHVVSYIDRANTASLGEMCTGARYSRGS